MTTRRPARNHSRPKHRGSRVASRKTSLRSPPAQEGEDLLQIVQELRVAQEELREQNQELAAAREALETEQSRYRDLFEFAPDAYLATTAGGTIRNTNAAASALLGVESNFLIGKPLGIFVSRAAHRDFQYRVSRMITARGTQNWETSLRPRSGPQFEAEVTVSPEWDPRGKVIGLRWLIRNVTPRKQFEQAIQNLNAELDRRVRERTAQLESANKQLRDEIRERQEAQHGLIDSNQRISAILDSITDAYIAFDDKWRVIDANQRAEEMILHKPKAEFLGKVLWEVHPQAKDSEIDRAVEQAFAEQRHVSFEAKSILAGRWMEIDVYPSRRGSDVYYRDISARKLEEETRARLAAIIESSDDAIIGLALDGKVTSWNPGAERLFGYSAAEAVGNSLSFIYPPELPDEFQDIVGRLQRGERIDHFETERLAKNGRRVFVSVSFSPVRDEGGRLIGFSKIARDIAAQRRARAAEHFLTEASSLMASSLDYASTLHTLAHLTVPFLADYCVVEIAGVEGEREQLAIAAREPEKEAFVAELINRYPLRTGLSGRSEVARTGQPLLQRKMTEVNLPWAGDPRAEEIFRTLAPVSYVIVPVVARGQVLGTMLLAYAESGRHYDDKDLPLIQDFARRAALEVDNARLYREAQAALIARDQFLSIASHEVRTPLAVIQGYAQLLRLQLGNSQGEPDAPVIIDRAKMRRALENIDHSSVRLITLVGDLLDVGRMHQRELSLSPERIDLKSMLTQVVESVPAQKQYHESKQDVVFKLSLPEGPVWGSWDRSRMEQVFVNLVDNALKYSPRRGSVKIGLTIEKDDTSEIETRRAHVTVCDEGIGIPAEDKDKIFEAFSRASNAAGQHYPGLGLGLAVTKEIVVGHGGCIWAESEGLGRGSTFHVVLPLPPEG